MRVFSVSHFLKSLVSLYSLWRREVEDQRSPHSVPVSWVSWPTFFINIVNGGYHFSYACVSLQYSFRDFTQ